jgi:hypothetical protein
MASFERYTLIEEAEGLDDLTREFEDRVEAIDAFIDSTTAVIRNQLKAKLYFRGHNDKHTTAIGRFEYGGQA